MPIVAERESVLQTVRGVYRRGTVKLVKKPGGIKDGDVLVTFLGHSPVVDLAERCISRERAADLRARLKTFASDWNRPEMDAYDAL